MASPGKSFSMAQLPTQSQFGDYGDWPGRDVLDSGGERLGGVREIYLDRETGRPEWVLVDVEGDEARFVPLADAEIADATIRVAHSAATIRTAPGIGTEPRIDQSEERRLYDHYGIGYSTDESSSGLPADESPTIEQEAVDEPEPSSWSDAAKTDDEPEPAPSPGEPPSPEEIEAAESHEPEAVDALGRRAVRGAGDRVAPRGRRGARAGSAARGRADLARGHERAARGLHGAGARRSPAAPAGTRAAGAPDAAALGWTPPPEPEAGGTLDAFKDRKTGVAVGVAIAAVLFLLIRKLR